MISTNILKEKRLMICVKAFFITWAVLLVFCGTVKNPLSVILFLGSAFVLEKMQDAEKYKDELSIKLCAGFFSLATALSGFKTYTESFENKLFQLIIILVIIAGMYLIYKQALMKLCQVFFDMKASNHVNNESSADISEKIPTDTSEKIPVDTKGIGAFGILEKHPVIIPMIICFICFLPYFLYEYPGIMSADSLVQYEQVIGVRPWTNHHPIVHTLCIYVLYNIGYTVTGDATKAIAFYTVAQMLFMSYVCGRLHKTLLHRGISRTFRMLTIAFYAIVPFNAVMSVTMWKDVPFAGVSVLLACCLLDFVNFKDENSSEKKLLINIRLYILGVAFSLMRTNAWYAFILTICLILWVFRKNIKRVLLTIGLIFLTVVLIKGPVMNTAGIEQPDFVESLCVP
ncbi:MAG: DUF6020 family protein, partial [Butyrivibrio sp.]|nr:DUF6020 family protein [Butyrivibrio sp.]